MVGSGGYDTKMTGSLGGPIGSGASFRGGSVEGPTRSLGGTGSAHNVPLSTGGPGSIGGAVDGNGSNAGVASPLIGSGAAGVGAGGGGALPGGPQGSPPVSPQDTGAMPGETYRAKALYMCEYPPSLVLFLGLEWSALCSCVHVCAYNCRQCESRRPERDFVCEERDSRDYRQARQVVAGKKRRRNCRK